MSLGTCRWDLWTQFWKMTYFDTITIVSNCGKLKIFVLVLVELISWSSNMTPLYNLEFNWSAKCPILCASNSVWHNLGFLINLYWTNLYQNCSGGCTKIVDQDLDKIYAKWPWVTQSQLCHQRATKMKFDILMLGGLSATPVQFFEQFI